jgi:hypothetical protein
MACPGWPTLRTRRMLRGEHKVNDLRPTRHAGRVLGGPGLSQSARRVRRLGDRRAYRLELPGTNFGHVSIYVAEEEDRMRNLNIGNNSRRNHWQESYQQTMTVKN